MAKTSTITREDILNDFAMEFESKAGVLERYLSEYPEYSLDLVDLSRELSREIDESIPLSEDGLATVNSAMSRLRGSSATAQPLHQAQPKVFINSAQKLGLPAQAGLALRERRVDASSIPSNILSKLANALAVSVEDFISYLDLPPMVSLTRASKSSIKPTVAGKVSFDRVLRDAGVDEETLSKLLNRD